ncbi:uncharacterized protein KZ484_019295 isoform 2-T2 [Pholidichthys leucotaenia]
MEDNNCLACDKEVRPRQEALLCDGCHGWQHCVCGTDFPQQRDCKEEVLADQQLWNQERISVLEPQEIQPPQREEQQELGPPRVKKEHKEPEPPRVKEEQDELFISQVGELPVIKLEPNTFMVTPISEENKQSEAEPNSEQVLSHISAVTEIQDEERSWHVVSGSIKKEEDPKPKKRQLKTRSHSNGEDDSLPSKTLCENETGKNTIGSTTHFN